MIIFVLVPKGVFAIIGKTFVDDGLLSRFEDFLFLGFGENCARWAESRNSER